MLSLLFRSRLICPLVLALAFAGCVPAGKSQGKISGNVKYKGQPVVSGVVNLLDKAHGTGATAPLDASGNFTVTTPLDVGTYNVSVTPPVPKQLPPGTPPEPQAPFEIPPKYQDPSQSDINKEIKTGDNKLDIVIPE